MRMRGSLNESLRRLEFHESGRAGRQMMGAVDETGFHAVENRHCVTGIYATVAGQMGIDIYFGEPI